MELDLIYLKHIVMLAILTWGVAGIDLHLEPANVLMSSRGTAHFDIIVLPYSTTKLFFSLDLSISNPEPLFEPPHQIM